jgi:hypothetical protein
MNGNGFKSFVSGNKYEGLWANDLKHGKGKFTWSGGNTYEGTYVNDKMHG